MPNGRIGRGVTGQAAIRAFQKLGFDIDRVRGSHYILVHSDGRRVTIPRHSMVKPGLLLDQLKKVGISWSQFSENL